METREKSTRLRRHVSRTAQALVKGGARWKIALIPKKSRRNRHGLPVALTLLFGALLFGQSLHAQPPNIVLILADDLGYGDLGLYGNTEPRTPNLDALGREGIRLTDFYVAPVCTPTRYGLLTGLHINRARDRLDAIISASNKTRGLRPEETTMAEVLRASGYRTALIGKWHLGHGDMTANPPTSGAPDSPFHPNNHGFDDFYGTLSGGVEYNTHWNKPHWLDWFENKQYIEGEDGLYATEQFTRRAVSYIEAHADESFFLYLSYTAPHNPLQLPIGREDHYLSRFDHLSVSPVRKKNLAMVSVMDDGIGEVLSALERTGIAEKTIVIFTSDNGGSSKFGGSNVPFRGEKRSLLEGGIRVPALIRWPGVIAAGQVSRQLAQNIDLLPTLLGLAGLPPVFTDGLDLSSHLRGGRPVRRDLFLFNPTYGSLYRQGRWKYVQRVEKGQKEELFDLETDPGEQADLSAVYPEKLEELRNLHLVQKSTFYIGEAGSVAVSQSSRDQWHHVALARLYRRPVVVLQPLSYNDPDPATVRVRDVTPTGFWFQVQEWDYLDGAHGQDSLHYLVLEGGRNLLQDGRPVQAGFTTTGSGFARVGFPEPFAAVPVVLSQVVSAEDARAVVTRQRSVTPAGFEVKLQGQEADARHGAETVAYVALASGLNTMGGRFYEVGLTPEAVGSAWYGISFRGRFPKAPVFVAAMQEADGDDPSGLRYRGLTTGGVEVSVQEEQSKDVETRHASESVGYAALEGGLIKGSPSAATAATAGPADAPGRAGARAGKAMLEEQPEVFGLAQNWPNPFNPVTRIRVSLAAAGPASLKVYDLVGREVAVLLEGERQAGVYEVEWTGRDDRGQALPSGLYLYRLVAGSYTEARTMTLLK